MSKEVKEIGKMGALALLSQMPVISAFSKFFEDYVNSNWQKRIELWKEETIKRLSKLDQDMEQKIRDMSNFANILATAQRGALEDIEEDKVGLYANTVINSIKNENIDNTKTHIFLNILRELSYLHLQVLKEIQSFVPSSSFEMNQFEISAPKRRLLKQINQKFNNNSLISIIIKNLFEKNLIEVEHLVDMHMRGSIVNDEYLPQALSPLGQEFLQFIAEQENSNG